MQLADRIAARQPPADLAILRQDWRDLLFVHWAVDPEVLRPLLPPRLTLDLFGGRAFVGLTPFRLARVRPRLMPPLPRVSRFGEVNVRTYVHLEGRDPGVWFFSLDASSRLAAAAARFTYRLPYHAARIHMESSGGRYRFHASRRGGGHCDAVWDVAGNERQASPGTLDFFLVERYVLYSESAGQLLQARVHHRPYPLRGARLVRLDQDLVRRDGIHLPLRQRPIVHFSPGVDVDVHAPRRVGEGLRAAAPPLA
jgi:uncharacterized protein YqjF (DUF2071 family)